MPQWGREQEALLATEMAAVLFENTIRFRKVPGLESFACPSQGGNFKRKVKRMIEVGLIEKFGGTLPDGNEPADSPKRGGGSAPSTPVKKGRKRAEVEGEGRDCGLVDEDEKCKMDIDVPSPKKKAKGAGSDTKSQPSTPKRAPAAKCTQRGARNGRSEVLAKNAKAPISDDEGENRSCLLVNDDSDAEDDEDDF
ncbi:unnamed protein product [Jaminaea pallidilutea]